MQDQRSTVLLRQFKQIRGTAQVKNGITFRFILSWQENLRAPFIEMHQVAARVSPDMELIDDTAHHTNVSQKRVISRNMISIPLLKHFEKSKKDKLNDEKQIRVLLLSQLHHNFHHLIGPTINRAGA